MAPTAANPTTDHRSAESNGRCPNNLYNDKPMADAASPSVSTPVAITATSSRTPGGSDVATVDFATVDFDTVDFDTLGFGTSRR